jgi:RNA polymerase subunit RPABC4/transcription elongation factor Spt4
MSEDIEVKFCRHCGELIPRKAVQCPYCEQQTIRGEERKECPFCGELIKGRAVKCKHCGEFLDGRPTPGSAPTLNIDKAIIAGRSERGEIEVRRPDGTRISPGELKRLQGAGGQESPRELPEGEGAEDAGVPARSEGAVEATPVPRRARQEAAQPAPAEEEAEEEPSKPPLRYECPGCGRYVFENDSYCENCGRDLSLPEGARSVPHRGEWCEATDYALMVSALGPVGLFLQSPFNLAVAGAGVVLGVGSLAWIGFSDGRLQGASRAGGAVALGMFWVVVLMLAGG